MANVQSLYGPAMERVEEGGEGVPLGARVLLLLLQREGVEQQVGGERHYQVLLWTQTQRPDKFDSVKIGNSSQLRVSADQISKHLLYS